MSFHRSIFFRAKCHKNPISISEVVTEFLSKANSPSKRSDSRGSKSLYSSSSSQPIKHPGLSSRAFLSLATIFAVTVVVSPSYAAPIPTTSRYMNTVDPAKLYTMGCQMGRNNQSGVVILDYGQPWYKDGQYGAIPPGRNNDNYFFSIPQITEASKQFLQGHYDCSGPRPVLRLAIGVSNYGVGTHERHGKAWATMLNNLDAWIRSNNNKKPGFSTQENIRGAIDIESGPGYSPPLTTKAWVNGYSSVSAIKYYNFGDAAGCPKSGTTSRNQACSNGWSQEDYWYVSWGAAPANPFPEIYNESNARQWQQIALYSFLNHGERMTILGALTQSQACKDTGQPCSGTNNSPEQGWVQLSNWLNSDSRTSQVVTYSSDISWRN